MSSQLHLKILENLLHLLSKYLDLMNLREIMRNWKKKKPELKKNPPLFIRKKELLCQRGSRRKNRRKRPKNTSACKTNWYVPYVCLRCIKFLLPWQMWSHQLLGVYVYWKCGFVPSITWLVSFCVSLFVRILHCITCTKINLILPSPHKS